MRIFSALSAPLRFKFPLFAKREQAIKANLRRLGYGGHNGSQVKSWKRRGRRGRRVAYMRIFSALSAPLRFKFPLFAKREQAINANLRNLGYGE